MKSAIVVFIMAALFTFLWVSLPHSSPCRNYNNGDIIKLFNCNAPMQRITWSF